MQRVAVTSLSHVIWHSLYDLHTVNYWQLNNNPSVFNWKKFSLIVTCVAYLHLVRHESQFCKENGLKQEVLRVFFLLTTRISALNQTFLVTFLGGQV